MTEEIHIQYRGVVCLYSALMSPLFLRGRQCLMLPRAMRTRVWKLNNNPECLCSGAAPVVRKHLTGSMRL